MDRLVPTPRQRDLILAADDIPGAYLNDLFDVETIRECRRNGWIRSERGVSFFVTDAGMIAVADL